MEGTFILLVVLAIGCILCGPIALIISIITLNRSREFPRPRAAAPWKPEPIPYGTERKPPEATAQRLAAADKASDKVPEEGKAESPLWPTKPQAKPAEKEGKETVTRDIAAGKKAAFGAEEKVGIQQTKLMLEQQIGTRWILIAGIVTVIFGVGFFLKYAYDSEWIGPTGRVAIAAAAGLFALAAGEITRRRGYDIVAKGVTALGLALLYLAVFAAHRYYGLMAAAPAFALAVLITATAMLYAVAINEVLTAFLSLLGGFLTPVIVSTGENLPMPLFIYVAILSVGAMMCAYYRKWRAVDLLSFIGTFALYTGWFEKFYRPTIKTVEGAPEQIAIALGWLAVFLVIYLVLPILYALVKKVKAQKEDVLLVLANAAVVFYYLWTILFDKFRMSLAFCAVGLCVAHLVMMVVVIKRCKDDLNLRLTLLAIGLFFLTIAMPLYLKMYAVAMAWAVEALVLVVIGLRYRSIWTQVGAAVALSLSLGQLLSELPMHTGAFQPVLNPAFGTWCFVAAVILICHLIYRKNPELAQDVRGLLAQIGYGAGVLLLTATFTMEWWWHCEYNLTETAYSNTYFPKGMVIIFTAFTLLLVVRPIRPLGTPCPVLAATLAAVGAIFTIVTFSRFYHTSFLIFANASFLTAVLLVAGMFLGGWLLKQTAEQERYGTVFVTMFTLGAIFLLWALLTEQIYLYWYCRNRFAARIANWRFLAHMYISVMWAIYGAALMTVGFWRKAKVLRYIALGLFGLLLAKVFILDTSTVRNVYRIAGFLATGVTLVAVSYLYQFLKKKGFFEAALAERGADE